MSKASDPGPIYHSLVGIVPDASQPLAAPADVARRVEEMYGAHARLVRSICRSLLRDRDDAEDAVQQTFLSAQRALANGSSPREPAAWLAVIARNECLARVRERMREPLPVDAEPTAFAADAHTVAVSRYEVATLREALADLPRAQREAILLRELRGLSYDEVARALSVTTGAVESLIFRARRTLQIKLSEALPALSPVALLGRLLGGGGAVAAPAVAKVAAVGIGAAVIAGGVALEPGVVGIGHGGAKPQRHASATQPHADSRWSARLSSTPSVLLAETQSKREAGSKGTESSDRRESTGSERSGSDGARSDGPSSERSSPDSSSSDNSGSDSSSLGSPSPGSSESDTGGDPTSTVPSPPVTQISPTDDTSTDPTETTDD
jgi:RNA polymerase sigma-70 factor (ECF subfamily)